MLDSSIFQAAKDLRWCFWCFERISEDRKCFRLQIYFMMSASVEMIFYWAWRIILVWENEPKFKETIVNDSKLRQYSSIEVYTHENSESVKNSRVFVSFSSAGFHRETILFQNMYHTKKL